MKKTSASGIRYSFQSVPSTSATSSVHLRLVCNVGSLHESDAQRGAAHYIEHLGFRATRKYDHGELVSLVTSFGSGFGPDLNAQTGLCETIWQLDLPKLDLLPIGLEILNEWAFWIRISQEDVDAERNVIIEEFRHKQTASQRAKSKFWDLALPIVAERIPIGTLDFIQTVSAPALRQFYNDHYVRENLCIVCVVEQGTASKPFSMEDFDLFMNHYFSVANCPVRHHHLATPPPPLPSSSRVQLTTQSARSACIVDPDLVQAAVSIEILTAHMVQSPEAFFRRDVVKRILSSIMDERFRHSMLESEVPLYSALGFSVAMHSPYVELSTIKTTFVLSPEQPQSAREISAIFTQLLNQIFHCATQGFSPEEVSHAKMKWRRNALQRAETGLGATEEWLEHFRMRETSPMWPFAQEQEIMLKLLGEDGQGAITTEEICEFSRDWLACLVVGNGSTKEGGAEDCTTPLLFFQGNRLPVGLEDGTLLEVLEQVRRTHANNNVYNAPSAAPSPPLPQFDCCEDELRKAVLTWPSGNKPLGQVVTHSIQVLPQTGVEVHRFALNGVELSISLMQSAEKKISLQAFALGGASEFDHAADDVCFSLCCDILRESGLGELSGSELLRLESCSGTRVFLQRHLHHRGLGGSAPSHELELLLNMVALRTEKIRIDPKVLTRVKHREREAVLANTMSEIQTAMRELAYGTTERLLLPHSLDDIDLVTPERLTRVLRQAFVGKCADFTFCMIGAFPADYHAVLLRFATRVLVNQTATMAQPLFTGVITPMKLTFDSPAPTRCLYQGEADTDKSQVTLILHPTSVGDNYQDIFFEGEEEAMAAVAEDDFFLNTALCEAIRLRLLAKLRTDRAQVYSVSCEYSSTLLATNASRMFITFSCNVERDMELVETTKQLLREMAVWGFSSSETETAYALMATKRTKSNTDGHKLFRLLDAFKLCGKDALAVDALVAAFDHTTPSPPPSSSLPNGEQKANQARKFRLRRCVARMTNRGINAIVIRHRPQQKL